MVFNQPLIRIQQRFPDDHIADVPGVVRRQLEASGVRVAAGAEIAIAVGSRGISHLSEMVQVVIEWLRAQGAMPFLAPAMGSHGGATAEGQQAVLEGYGLSEAQTGVPIRSSLAVVELPGDGLEVPVYFDRHAYQADGTIILNRIKPHTSFRGTYESGLMKMLAIGLGKHAQALTIHQYGVPGLRDLMPRVAQQILRHGNILLGIGVVENAYDEPCEIQAIPAGEIPQREPGLLLEAKARMPRLPVEEIDLLIVDEMGKDISGLGMDPNIIGRLNIAGEAEPDTPRIKTILVRDLSAGSHGNAAGMGLADIITRRAVDKIDFAATYANVTTTGFLERGKLPVVAEDEQQALAFAARTWGPIDPKDARILRIKNTLCLAHLLVSPRVAEELGGRGDIRIGEVTNDWFVEI